MEQSKLFKQRMMSVILATDMSRHINDLNAMKSILEVDLYAESGLNALINSTDQEVSN